MTRNIEAVQRKVGRDNALFVLSFSVDPGRGKRAGRKAFYQAEYRVGEHLSPRFDAPRADRQYLRARCDLGKGRGVGAAQKNLRAEVFERLEQRDPPRRIEMGDDLVEQQHRRKPGHVRNQARMRQHQIDQQRLLLAGRGLARRDPLGAVNHVEVGEMRAVERAAGGGIAAATLLEGGAVAILDLAGRVRLERVLDRSG